MSNLNHKRPITSPRTHFFVPFHLYKTTSPGSAFSTITFSRLRLLIYLYNVLLDTRYQQQPPRSQTGGYTCDCRRRGSASYAAQPASHQYGQLWHAKRSPASQREQSYPYNMCSVSLIIWTQQYALPAVQHAYHNVGHVQGVPERQRVIYPVRTNLSSPHVFSTRPFAAPPRSPVPYPPAHQAPTRGLPASENLRRLANHYVQHPGSRVNSVCMERGTAGRYKVTIALEVTDFL
ncbi:hypothetical protein F5888DRAFT_1655210 [Russula emetica]|nr:hypothetical protein F5888DRAFT_1655210 [Russula emetica]